MKLKVGQVVKAQGIKGEMKVVCFLDSANLLKDVKEIYLQSNLHKVSKLRADGAFFYLLLEDVSDRNAAESFRGWEVFCNKTDVRLEQGRFFVEDVLGCRVVLDDGTAVGEVTEVLQYGAADVYVCKNAVGGEVSFPALKDLLVSVDTDLKKIVLSAKRFGEVSVTNED